LHAAVIGAIEPSSYGCMLSRRSPLPAVGFSIGSAWACIVIGGF
jgi:hypothetical protein